jgi:hypothetical protein
MVGREADIVIVSARVQLSLVPEPRPPSDGAEASYKEMLYIVGARASSDTATAMPGKGS